MIKEAIHQAAARQNLSYQTAEAVMDEIMSGQATDVQMASYLTALSVKGESIDEITASAAAMRRHCVRLLHDLQVLEIVGTGGDHAHSFNISTASALAVSAAGVPVAKHGNRAASSLCGSADVLEALGAVISLPPERSREILHRTGFCFLFAQNYHIAMKYVAPVRRELGIRTIFNILGPLANPAGASMQLLGVYDPALVEPLAQVLARLGVVRAMVVYGQDGLDEISLSAPTTVCELREGKFAHYTITPEQLGLTPCQKEDLVGGTPAQNAAILRDIFAGKPGAPRDAVLLNAGVALHIARPEINIEEAIGQIRTVIDSGRAMEHLERYIACTREGT